MSKLQTTRKVVLNLAQAVASGVARDQKGREHIVVASGESYLITRVDGVEHVFRSDGSPVEPFDRMKLVYPSLILEKVKTYLAYDANSMTAIEAHDSFRIASKEGAGMDGADIQVINTTHPIHQELLDILGVSHRKWYRMAEACDRELLEKSGAPCELG